MTMISKYGLPGYGTFGTAGEEGVKGVGIKYRETGDASLIDKDKSGDFLLDKNFNIKTIVKNENNAGYLITIGNNDINKLFTVDKSTLLITNKFLCGDAHKSELQINESDAAFNIDFLDKDSSIISISDSSNKHTSTLKYNCSSGDCSIVFANIDDDDTTKYLCIDDLYVNTNLYLTQYHVKTLIDIKNILILLVNNNDDTNYLDNLNNDDNFKENVQIIRISSSSCSIIKNFNSVLNNKIEKLANNEYYEISLKIYEDENDTKIIDTIITSNDTNEIKDIKIEKITAIDIDNVNIKIEDNIIYIDRYDGSANANKSLTLNITCDSDVYYINNTSLDGGSSKNITHILNNSKGKYTISLKLNNTYFTIKYNNNSESSTTPEMTCTFSSDNYLDYSKLEYGVPANAFIETYDITFEHINQNTSTHLSCDVSVKYMDDIDNSTHWMDVSIINGDLNSSVISNIIDNASNPSTNSYISNIKDFSIEKDGVYKLVIYHEFNEPIHTIATTHINATINVGGENKPPFEKDTSTYIIPWQLRGAVYNDSILQFVNTNALRYDNRAFEKLQIVKNEKTNDIYNTIPSLMNYNNVKFYPINKDEFKDISTYNNFNYISNRNDTMYPSNSFLMIGYNKPNTDNIFQVNSFYFGNNFLTSKTYYNQYEYQYAQVENKYPMFIGNTSYEVTIENIDSSITKINSWNNNIINDKDHNLYDPSDSSCIVIYNITQPVEYKNIFNINNNKFLSFARWTVHNTTFDSSDNKYTTYVYPMRDSLACRKRESSSNITHYGLYWNCDKKIVYKTYYDSLYNIFDGAVNLLCQPKIGGSIKTNYGITNEYFNNDSSHLRDMSVFTINDPDIRQENVESITIETNPSTTIINNAGGGKLTSVIDNAILGKVVINKQVHNTLYYNTDGLNDGLSNNEIITDESITDGII